MLQPVNIPTLPGIGDGRCAVSNERGVASRVEKRKGFTFYYEPFQASSFDTVIVPIGLAPMVQYSIYLRMQYPVWFTS